MDVNFEYNNVKASNELEDYSKERLNKLTDKYEFIVKSEVFFKIENTPTNDTGGKFLKLKLVCQDLTYLLNQAKRILKQVLLMQ